MNHPTIHVRRANRSAFALMEMLVCIGLTAMAITIAGRLFVTIIRSYREVPAASRVMQTRDQWLGVLRSDAWSATDQFVFDGRQVTFVIDTQPIVWRQEEGTLIRQFGEDRRQWPLEQPLTWSLDHAILTLSEGDAHIALATPVKVTVTP